MGIGGRDDGRIVFDDDDRVTPVAQFGEQLIEHAAAGRGAHGSACPGLGDLAAAGPDAVAGGGGRQTSIIAADCASAGFDPAADSAGCSAAPPAGVSPNENFRACRVDVGRSLHGGRFGGGLATGASA